MKNSAVLGIGLGVIAVAAIAGYFSFNPPTHEQVVHPHDTDSLWICLGGSEPHDFRVKVRDLAKTDQTFACPVCGSDDIFLAKPCDNCGRFYPVGRWNASPANCMHCGVELPGRDVDGFHAHEGH